MPRLISLIASCFARVDVAGAVHHAHATLADTLQELVAPQATAQVGV